MTRHRLVTLIGAGGMDKTLLARLLESPRAFALRFGMHVLCSDYPALLAALEGRRATAQTDLAAAVLVVSVIRVRSSLRPRAATLP